MFASSVGKVVEQLEFHTWLVCVFVLKCYNVIGRQFVRFFLIYFTYLKDRDIVRQRSPNCWFTPLASLTAKNKIGWSQEPEIQSESPMCVLGIQTLDPSSVAAKGAHYQDPGVGNAVRTGTLQYEQYEMWMSHEAFNHCTFVNVVFSKIKKNIKNN